MSTYSRNRKNVLLLIPNLGRGGAQKVFLDQFENLTEQFNVTGCVFNWDGAFVSDKRDGIVSLNVPAGGNIVTKLYYFFLRIIRLRRLKSQWDIHVCISHLEGADYVNVLSKKNEKVVCWIHGTKQYDLNIQGFLGFVRKHFLMPFLYTRANELVAVSKGIANELMKYRTAQKTVRTIYNGFDVGEIIKYGQEDIEPFYSEVFNNSKIVITHCRLSRQKNLVALLAIIAKTKNAENVKFLIVGDGELREDLISKCHDLNIQAWNVWTGTPPDAKAHVFFVGQQSNPFKFLRRSSLYMMTSQWEGFPLALCEAMACGLPVMVADCFTGPREIIAPEMQLPQPISKPYVTVYGVLMPMVTENDKKSVTVWADEFNRYMSEIQSKPYIGSSAVQRIKQLDIRESIAHTQKLINQLLL